MKLTVVAENTHIYVKRIAPMLDGNILIYDSGDSMKVYNRGGKPVNKEYPLPCQHIPVYKSDIAFLHMKIGYKPYIVFLCALCQQIYLLDPVSKRVTVTWSGEQKKTIVLVEGPERMLFMNDKGYDGVVLKLNCSKEKFEVKGKLEFDFKNIDTISALRYEKTQHVLIASKQGSSPKGVYVEAVKCDTSESLWQIRADNVSEVLQIHGICSDGQGNVLMTDFGGHCVFVVNAETGKILRRELVDVTHPSEICYFNNQPQIVVARFSGNLFICNVQYD